MSRDNKSVAQGAVQEKIEALIARIDELETRTAFQDDLLSSLNDVIAAQDRRMATLARLLEQTREQLNAQGVAASEGGDTAHEPPPHY